MNDAVMFFLAGMLVQGAAMEGLYRLREFKERRVSKQ